MRYLNLLVFISLSILLGVFFQNIKISTNFMDALFSKETTKIYEISQKLGSSSHILISSRGFDKKGLNELYEIKDELLKLDDIDSVKISLTPSKEMQEYIKQNYYLLADFKNTEFSKEEIKNRLQKIYDDISTSVFYTPIDTSDPLGLFKFQTSDAKRYLELKNFGYILKASTKGKLQNADSAKLLYDKIHEITDKYPNSISFAPFYFLVENSAYIKSDANKIIMLSSILLLVLYFFILKNIKLFFNTVITLGSSAMAAILASTLLFGEINIIALVFGISITTISIDYMFHYYFHNEFEHKGFIKQKRVFFGFITTFGVFLIFSTIDIKLFAQLSFFSMASLLSAYILFSLAFGYLGIRSPSDSVQKQEIRSFNPIYISIISILMLTYASLNLKFDSELKNLDYQNTKLQEISKRFATSIDSEKKQKVLIASNSKDDLLENFEKLKKDHPSTIGIGNFLYSDKKCHKKLEVLKSYDFKKLNQEIREAAKELGFSNIFDKTYLSVTDAKCIMDTRTDLGFKIVKDGDKFYTLALVDKDAKISQNDNVIILDMMKILSKNLDESKDTVLTFTLISLSFILILLFSISKKKILYPLSYIIFPVSVVLFFLSFYTSLNLMHIFAIVILIAIGIDYGIYMLDTTTHSQTTKAIRYAMLSTFAGFGVLVFSSVNSLHSIGFVISVGIAAIFILLTLKGNR